MSTALARSSATPSSSFMESFKSFINCSSVYLPFGSPIFFLAISTSVRVLGGSLPRRSAGPRALYASVASASLLAASSADRSSSFCRSTALLGAISEFAGCFVSVRSVMPRMSERDPTGARRGVPTPLSIRAAISPACAKRPRARRIGVVPSAARCIFSIIMRAVSMDFWMEVIAGFLRFEAAMIIMASSARVTISLASLLE